VALSARLLPRMPLAAKAPLFSPGVRVTLTALKWSGTSVTVGNLVAGTTVRMIADGADLVCAVAEAASATAPSSGIPIVLNHAIMSKTEEHPVGNRLLRVRVLSPSPLLAKFRNGARIVKVACEEGDANPVGILGTVLASHEHPAFGVSYFVEWDTYHSLSSADFITNIAESSFGIHSGARGKTRSHLTLPSPQPSPR
jgi:hypothetical protein